MDFAVRGWIDWDSNDEESDMYYLLEEVIIETGFKSSVAYTMGML